MIASRSMTLSDVLQIGAFEPAKIQREFQWQRSHVERLLDDLIGAFQRAGGGILEADAADAAAGESEAGADAELDTEMPDTELGADAAVADGEKIASTRTQAVSHKAPKIYFIGGVIFLKTVRSNSYVVYDGLQRLTSLTVLLAIFRETWTDQSTEDTAAINALLYEADETPRLSFPTIGRSLTAILAGRKAQARGGMTDGDRNMRHAADYFRKAFARWKTNERRAFFSFLQTGVMLTVTEVDNPSVAYQMFVGANTRGLKLDVGDVLKGTLAEQVRHNGGTIDQVTACAKSWGDAQNRLRKGFNEFVHAIEVLKFRPAYRHTTGELLTDMFDDTTPPQEILDWMDGDFANVVRVFDRARAHNREEIATLADISLRQLSFLGWTEWQPLYIAIALTHADLHGPKFIAEIAALQRVCFMIELLSWSENKRRRRFFDAIAQREANINPFTRNGRGKTKGSLWFDMKERTAAKRALRFDLTSKEKRGAIVRWIETLHWGRNVPRSATNDATVEHVLPMTPVDGWLVAFSDEEREECTNRLGNLFILDEKCNKDIGNKEWSVKREAYLKWRTDFRGVGIALDQCGHMTDEGGPAEGGPGEGGGARWNAKVVADLTEVLAQKADKALGL
jgi:hypothetical protein